jgi:CheY-like chemotaxis protein
VSAAVTRFPLPLLLPWSQGSDPVIEAPPDALTETVAGEQALRILVVDDNPAVLESLELLLTALGYQVSGALNGIELRARLTPPPDLVLMDLMMPGESGEELIHWLRSQEAWRAVPVVIISAHPQAAEIAARLAVAGVLMKPFEAAHLAALLQRLGLR